MALDIRLATSDAAADDAALLLVHFATDPAALTLSDGAAAASAHLIGPDVLSAPNEVHLLGGAPLQAVVGLGPWVDVTLETLRRGAALAVGTATDLRRERVALALPSKAPAGASVDAMIEAVAEGAGLAAQARTPRPTVSPRADAARPPSVCLLRLDGSGDQSALRQGLRRAAARVSAVTLARELADTPANLMSPLELARRAAAAAESAGLAVEVLEPEQLARLGTGLLLAVGRGSSRPPALGVLRYRPNKPSKHVAVVGKGITFDAGGISIKPAKDMAHMVHDKAGAAAAAAIAIGAAALGLNVAVTAILACAENLPGGSAYRPGDVLTGLDGSTVEVVDTDAEGRLVLADALTYAVRLAEPTPVDAIVDLATLTGSIVAALGNEAAGLFANDETLAQRMLEAARVAGEPLWRMPILSGHRAQLKSERADRKQCADRWGDCAIAAAFLEAYVAERPWAHLDIAGVAYDEGSPEWPPYHPKQGAAGTGVRTVLRFLEGELRPASADRARRARRRPPG